MYYMPEINFTPDQIIEYLRKSRSDDPSMTVEEVLAKHEAILSDWCDRNIGGNIPEDNIYREVVSGETIDDRPEMKKLLKQIESPKIKAVLVVEVQRLSRGDLEDAGRIIKLFRYTNTMIITPQKVYDLRDEYDRDMFERELKRGNEFLEYQKKIMGRGRILSVQQGNYIGSVPPYGYERIFVQDGKRKCPTLKIKEDEAEVVRMIFDMYVNQDLGYIRISRKLDDMHIKPPKGEYWSSAALRNMLDNIHYIGKVKWNQRKTVNVIENGEVIKTRPVSKENEYMIFEGKHEAIIDEALFYAAKEKQGKNYRAKPDTKIRNPFAGLLFCQCGRAMSLRTYKKKGIERSQPRLLCDHQYACGTSSCLYSEMVDRVKEILQQNINDFEVRINENTSDSLKHHTNLINALKTQLEEIEKKELRQWEKYADGEMPKEIFDKLNEKVQSEKQGIEDVLCKAYDEMPEPIDYEKKLMTFKEALASLDDDSVPPERKNRLLKACIERIDYNREKSVRTTKSAENGAKMKRGSNWTWSPIELDVKLKL